MTYTYYVADVLTGAVLGDLPFSDTKAGWALSDTGKFEGKLAISDPEVLARGGLGLTRPGQHAVYVDLDGDLIWAGIVWSRKRSLDGQTLTVSAADYWSYFSRRLCTVDITFAGEIMDLVPLVLTPALDAYKPANLTVEYTTPPEVYSAPQVLEYTYVASDRKKCAELVSGLAEGVPGFDFRCEAQWTVTGLTAAVKIVFGKPYLGKLTDASPALFDFPGNIVEYEEDEDASDLVGRLFVRGTDSGEDEAVAPEFSFEDISAYTTYPRYEDAVSIDEPNPAVVSTRGQAAFNQRKVTRITRSLKVRADAEPRIGTYHVGDWTQLVLRDASLSGTVALRIAALDLSPKDQVVDITPWDPSSG